MHAAIRSVVRPFEPETDRICQYRLEAASGISTIHPQHLCASATSRGVQPPAEKRSSICQHATGRRFEAQPARCRQQKLFRPSPSTAKAASEPLRAETSHSVYYMLLGAVRPILI